MLILDTELDLRNIKNNISPNQMLLRYYWELRFFKSIKFTWNENNLIQSKAYKDNSKITLLVSYINSPPYKFEKLLIQTFTNMHYITSPATLNRL